jgi:hypothetical protein
MPFGLQITGRFRGDRDLLDAAEALEQAFAAIPTLRRPRPDLLKLAKPSIDLKSIVTHPPVLQEIEHSRKVENDSRKRSCSIK